MSLRRAEKAFASGVERLDRRRAAVGCLTGCRVQEADRHLHVSRLWGVDHQRVLTEGAEPDAAVAHDLYPHVVEVSGGRDRVGMVPELEDAVVTAHELVRRDARAEDVRPAFGA